MDMERPPNELLEKFKRQTEELASFFRMGKLITPSLDLGRLLDLTTEMVTHLIDNACVCTLRLLNDGGKMLTLKSAFGLDHADSATAKLKIEETPFSKVVRTKRPYRVGDLPKSDIYKFPAFVKAQNFLSLLAVPLLKDREPIGVLTVYGKGRDGFSRDDVKLLALFANQVEVSLEIAGLLKETKKNYLDMMRVLSAIAEAKDPFTRGHSQRVTKYALAIAKELGFDDMRMWLIRCAGLLHDIGKIAIDSAILYKPGKLTKREWVVVRKHPVVASDIIAKIEVLDELVSIVRHHHERFDGGGYPDGIKGNKVPLEARILAVADSFEAMTSERPYRRAMSEPKAIAELRRCSGAQFDPMVVRAFLKTV